MAGEIEKSTTPTSKYSVECDHHDTKLRHDIHEVESDGVKKWKGHIIMEDKEGKQIKLSLYKEDVMVMAHSLLAIAEIIDGRRES